MHRKIGGIAAVCFALCGALTVSTAQAQYTSPVALQQNSETAATAPTVQKQTVVNVAAGATLNSGNTKAYSANVGGRLVVTRFPHQLTIEALGTLGYAQLPNTTETKRNAANVFGRGRYDYFLSRNDALFAAVQPRRDVYAGLEARIQNQVGYLRNLFFPSNDHRFWTELGYDLTLDQYAKITTTTDVTATYTGFPPGYTLPAGYALTQTVTKKPDPSHDRINSARLFFGYTNRLNAMANLNTGVESLFDVQDKKNIRVNTLVEFTSTVSKLFKLGITNRMFFNNVPAPGIKHKADSVSTLSLIYTFDSLANAPAPAAPAPCDCTNEVDAAKAECAAQQAVPTAPEPASAPSAEPASSVEPAAATPPAEAPSAPVAPAEPAATEPASATP